MDAMLSFDESDDELTMLEAIHDSSHSHLRINKREARYVIRLNQVTRNGKERYNQRKTWVKVYTSYLRLFLMIFCNNYQVWMNLDQKFLTSFQNLETLQK